MTSKVAPFLISNIMPVRIPPEGGTTNGFHQPVRALRCKGERVYPTPLQLGEQANRDSKTHRRLTLHQRSIQLTEFRSILALLHRSTVLLMALI
jgi:hypothetical protein